MANVVFSPDFSGHVAKRNQTNIGPCGEKTSWLGKIGKNQPEQAARSNECGENTESRKYAAASKWAAAEIQSPTRQIQSKKQAPN
jgi:hypothetical protein